MNNKIIFVLVISFTLFLVACNSHSPQISLESYEFEFGDVVNGTIVSKDILVENSGDSPLIIEDVSTSCGCTTAAVEPKTISPGERGILHIEFDSGAHGPEMEGIIMRQVFLKTNDPKKTEVMVEFSANVVLD